MEPVKRLKRELRAQGTVIGLYKDTVEVNGQIAEWDYIHHDGAACVVAVTDNGKLGCHYENTVLITENGPEILTLVK